jgi:signal transduction histidine kinase
LLENLGAVDQVVEYALISCDCNPPALVFENGACPDLVGPSLPRRQRYGTLVERFPQSIVNIGIAAAIAIFLVVRELSPGVSDPSYFSAVALISVALLLVSGILHMVTTVWHTNRLAFFVVGVAGVTIFMIKAGFDARSFGIAIFWLVAESSLLLGRLEILAVWSAMAGGYLLNEIWIAPGLADDRPALRILATLSVTLASGSLTAAALAIRTAQRDRVIANRLRELDDMKNTLLQAVSHELRTPLATVMGYAMLLESRGDEMPAEKRKTSVQGITDGARKLDKLLADLIDVDRLRRGLIAPQRTPTDVAVLVRRVLDETPLGEHPVEAHLPSVVVDLDAPKVERIVENLICNAAKYSPDQGPIRVGLKPRSDGVVICVEDEGPGIPDTLKETVFGAFERGEQVSAHTPGVGIGLSLVARFAELHGGSARVEDRRGGGSRFTVVLPGPEG